MRSKQIFLLVTWWFAVPMIGQAEESVRVLLLSGRNNHDWQKTTPCLQQSLDASGFFTVRITEEPQECTAEDFAACDVIVSNWNAFGVKGPEGEWSATTQNAFVAFIKRGGGHVTVHAGGSSMAGWPVYRRIAASWGKETSHGPVHTFTVDLVDAEHPMVQGVAPFSIRDELWNRSQFPPKSRVLMAAHSDKANRGTGQMEPVLCVSHYERGRCVNLMLGHDVTAMQNPGFQKLLQRSCLWAASREVKKEVRSN